MKEHDVKEVIQFEKILVIIGAFGTIALSINAFFLKGIYDDINTVKISMSGIISNSESKERRISKLETKDEKLEARIRALENRMK